MKKKAIILGLVTSMVGLTFAGCTSSGSTETTTTTSAINVSVPEDATTTTAKIGFENKKLTLHDGIVEITDYEIIPAKTGSNEYGEKPIIVFYYDVTNSSDKEYSASEMWIANFEAYQDNDPNKLNKLQVAAWSYNNGETSWETIKKGGTVSDGIAYELDDLKTSVTLKAYNFNHGDLGSQEFKLVTE